MSANLYELLRTRFPADPEAPVFLTTDGGRMSYGELDTAAARAAAALRGLGVAKGDRVAVQVDKSIAAVALYLGCLRVGAVYLPLNTGYMAAEVSYFLGDAEPHLLICTPVAEPALRDVSGQAGVAHVLTLDDDGSGTWTDTVAGYEPDPAIEPADADDLAAILYTSGTTGRSKGAMLSHRNLASNAQTLHRIWGFRDGDVLIHALPIFHVHGLFIALHCALLNGSAMWFLPKFDADTVIDLLPKATVLMGVPTFYTRLLDNPRLTTEQCSHMRLFIAGSAPLLPDTFDAFTARTGHRILERYGMTETGMITSNPLDGERLAGTVGFALPDVQVRVADDDGTMMANGETGVLEITGPNVFGGYWRMPEKTRTEFRDDGWFITGDLAAMAQDGRVSIVGRAKDLIISGGYNVYPKEIEAVIDEVPGVLESAVIGVPHPDFGEAVTAVVVRDGSTEVDETAITASTGAQLAKFKNPKRVYFVDALPRNAMGKVQKNALRKEYEQAFAG